MLEKVGRTLTLTLALALALVLTLTLTLNLALTLTPTLRAHLLEHVDAPLGVGEADDARALAQIAPGWGRGWG